MDPKTADEARRENREYSEALAREYARLSCAHSRAHAKLTAWALRKYGNGNGRTVSGVVREHFPEPIKDRLRQLARWTSKYSDESRADWKIAGRRLVTWRRMYAETAQRDGTGFYG